MSDLPVKKPTLYLHIGHPKTASTTLQEFLYRNWGALEAAGFALPTASLDIAQGTETPPGNPLWTLEKIKECGSPSALTRWVENACEHSEKLILSSECLIQEEYPSLFREVSEKTNLHLIYYVRRQDKLLLSAWRQWGLKRGLSLEEFLARRLKNKQPDFNRIVQHWADVCDIKQYHVRFLDPRFLKNGDIIRDFCSAIGFDAETVHPVEDQNISVDARLALFMSAYPDLFDGVHDEEIFSLLRHKPEEGDTAKLCWTPAQFEAVRNIFEPLNQQLLRTYNPSSAGTAVIDESSAPIGSLPSAQEQRAYIEERLRVSPNTDHPKLLRLSEILAKQGDLT